MANGAAEPGVPAYRAGAAFLSSRRRAPERLPGIVDSHAHLQHQRFDGIRDVVIERAVEAGIERILVPGWDIASSEAALELAARHGSVIQAGVGVHPHDAATVNEAGWARLEALAADGRASAIGEIGLDHFRNLSPPQIQLEAFRRQLDLAHRLEMPVLVHDRDAHGAVTDELMARPMPRGGVLHAFSGDAGMAERLTNAGYLVSFALPVAFRSATGPRAAATALPEGTFVVETDAPYLGPDRERTNEPTTVLRVLAELARLRGVEVADLVAPVRAAYDRLLSQASSGRPPT